jgi:succinate-semialdehyde dehydrogenase / glutarate-semialdehyde dehydrogenase
MKLKSINPYNGKVLDEFEEMSDTELQSVIERSGKAFDHWRLTDTDLRSSMIRKVASILQSNAELYASAITEEMGKPLAEARAEVEKCAWVCNYYAENAPSFLKEEEIITDAGLSYVKYEPLGVILGIMPWNFPFWQVIRFAAPTLLAGNTILLKHASNVQRCAGLIEQVFAQAGFPGDVFRNLITGSARMEKVIANDIVKAVSLTGSESAGRSVASVAGKYLKKCLLELGGNNAFIVLEDADVVKAAEAGIKARMMNCGQSCIAAKRFIIHHKSADRFTNLFLNKLGKLRSGDPSDKETTIGPLSSVQQAEIVEDQVKRSVSMGARVLTGGVRNGAFYSPSVVVDVGPGMPLFDEEVFGPVAPFIVAGSDDEAISLACDTRFGLGVTIFTNDTEKAAGLSSRFSDGAVFINEHVKSDPRLPFGGTGISGYGRELSIQGIREFVNVKTIYIRNA